MSGLFSCFLFKGRLKTRHLYGRAVSSAGRASRLHRGGQRFEPVTAHHFLKGIFVDIPVFKSNIVWIEQVLEPLIKELSFWWVS